MVRTLKEFNHIKMNQTDLNIDKPSEVQRLLVISTALFAILEKELEKLRFRPEKVKSRTKNCYPILLLLPSFRNN